MQIATTVEIEAPLDRVWPLINDDENLKLWMPVPGDALKLARPRHDPHRRPDDAAHRETAHGEPETGR
jgi:uncharacterized protein YndB with AHSA1/START domain